MTREIWNPANCKDCELFPAACPHMSAELKNLLASAVEKFGGDDAAHRLSQQALKRCEGDCEACTLPEWMQNC